MKNTKYIFISLASAVILLSSHISTIVAGVTHDPGFEVFNKSATPIQIIISLDKQPLKPVVISAGKKYSCAIELTRSVQLTINTQPAQLIDVRTKDKSKSMHYVYDLNAPGKTKYVSWNPDDKSHAANPLYPQTGPWMGLLGKTESGFPLGNNVTQSEITYVR